MALSIGTRLGPYEILAPLGAGGMGEVYKAKDTRLDRTVAIKVLPPHSADNPEARQRFEREARAVSSLNHPHICTLYDVGRQDNIDYLVMEHLEGESLSTRLAAGPLPVDQALCYAVQIAEALADAHRHGVFHRDLKPGNIILAKSGAKLLDFGLAKMREAVPGGAAGLTVGPSKNLTQVGSILGTLQYMAPEQVEGKDADARSDLFAFGAVLYEMLTGHQAFSGNSAASLITAIMSATPPPVSSVQPVAPALDRIVRRCLAKDPDQRWQTAQDLASELKWLADGAGAATVSIALSSPPVLPGAPSRLPWVVAGVVAAILAAALILTLVGPWRGARPAERSLMRLSVDLGPEAVAGANTTVAISPDGTRIVFPGRGPGGKQQLATRTLDQAQTTILPGTENGRDPFFSPDGQWVGFFADGRLKKISVQGGAPVTLCDAPSGMGATWGDDGNIIGALMFTSGLSRVPAAGGRPQPLTRIGRGEVTHRWPQLLPGGEAVLFTASGRLFMIEDANIEVLSLKTGETKTLQRGGYFGRYLATNGSSGHLVYIHQGVLFGVPFDPARLELGGSPAPLLESVAGNPTTGGGQLDFSRTGTFVYMAGKGQAQDYPVVWLDSSGETKPLVATPGIYSMPRFSPDGRRLAVVASSGNSTDAFVYDWQRDTITRLTFNANVQVPVWTPDGKHLAFGSNSIGSAGLSWIRSDGGGDPQRLLESQNNAVPYSFSPDGRRLAYFEINPETGYDIWMLPLDMSDSDHPKPGKPELFLRTQFNEYVPAFSPDGRWIAYRSDESGINEIYVRPFPVGGGKWQISTGGGLYGIWSNNGREFFYETLDNRIRVADYTANGDSFVPGKPRVWSERQIYFPSVTNLALAPDGKRFAVLAAPEAAGGEKGSVRVTFLLNFFDELRRRLPAAR